MTEYMRLESDSIGEMEVPGEAYYGVQADDLFDATENLDGFVRVSSCLKACAINLSKMCNDLRILASGPKAGFGEITLRI